MIRISSDHAVFSWVYNNYKSFLSVEIYEILLATQNRICFERLIQKFDILFECIFQEEPRLKLLNIHITRSKYGIIIEQTYHIMIIIIQ